jgi:ABC-type branched-subunit amino acid transport system substrate-binding protein
MTSPVRFLTIGFFIVTIQVVPERHLRIGLVTPSIVQSSISEASAARGIRLGAEESKQTAGLFGNNVDLYEAAGTGDAAAVTAATSLSSARQIQVLIGTSARDAEALSRYAETRGILYFNVASRSAGLRSACRRHTFHIEATDGMYATAAGFVRSKILTPGAASEGNSTASVVLWSPDLERFGASQINDRFRRKYGLPMDGSAWAGWAAVKIVAEAALRAGSTTSSRMLAYLESPASQFDGHKGWPLTFRKADHQLRQPLYLVTRNPAKPNKDLTVDVPDLRAVSSSNGVPGAAAAALDQLIATPTAPCVWSRR